MPWYASRIYGVKATVVCGGRRGRLSDTMMWMAEQESGNMPEAWRRTELARHPDRPYPMDFIDALFTDFSEIHGDRAFGDDPAMTCGMARFHGRAALVVANLKGRHIKGTRSEEVRIARS